MWLAQAILGTLRIDKLDAWIRQAGLADDIERLRREVERVEVAVSAVRGRAAANEPLARSLARLKDLLYEADEVVDDLDYCRLQQQVQGGTRNSCRSIICGTKRDFITCLTLVCTWIICAFTMSI